MSWNDRFLVKGLQILATTNKQLQINHSSGLQTTAFQMKDCMP